MYMLWYMYSYILFSYMYRVYKITIYDIRKYKIRRYTTTALYYIFKYYHFKLLINLKLTEKIKFYKWVIDVYLYTSIQDCTIITNIK